MFISLITKLFLLLAVFVSTVAVSAHNIPRLRGRVNDNAKIISPEVEKQIEQAIKVFEQKNAGQIVVLTVSSISGHTIEEYSIEVAEAWKIGTKGNDDGVIFIVAPNERKVRIEVGYGFEHVLTDLISSQIINNTVLPKFQQNDYSSGIKNGIFEIINVVSGEYPPPYVPGDYASEKNQIQKAGENLFGLLFFVIIMIFLLSGRGGRGAFFRGMLFSMLLSGGRGGRGGFSSGGGFSGFGGGFGGGGASGRW